MLNKKNEQPSMCKGCFPLLKSVQLGGMRMPVILYPELSSWMITFFANIDVTISLLIYFSPTLLTFFWGKISEKL
jgi:hypothetical protein